MDRHGRQVRLAEVGVDGQARIASASVDVGLDGAAADVAVRYLAGAGVARIRVREPALVAVVRAIDPALEAKVDEGLASALAPSHVGADVPLRDPVARDLARGSLFALGALVDALRGTRQAS